MQLRYLRKRAVDFSSILCFDDFYFHAKLFGGLPDAALIASDTEIAELACPDNQRLARREQRCWPSHRL
jgi:hypothetical protein